VLIGERGRAANVGLAAHAEQGIGELVDISDGWRSTGSLARGVGSREGIIGPQALGGGVDTGKLRGISTEGLKFEDVGHVQGWVVSGKVIAKLEVAQSILGGMPSTGSGLGGAVQALVVVTDDDTCEGDDDEGENGEEQMKLHVRDEKEDKSG
jgi:hypothetical protein